MRMRHREEGTNDSGRNADYEFGDWCENDWVTGVSP